MMTNTILLDRLKPIYFKDEIDVIYLTHTIHFEMLKTKSIDTTNVLKTKIHNLRHIKEKTKIFSYLVYENNRMNEYFFNLNDYLESFSQQSIYEVYYKKLKSDDELLNDILNDMLTKILIKNLYMIIIYEYKYIKGSKGQKELVPVQTKLNKNLRCSETIKLCNNFIGYNVNFYNTLEYYFKAKKKKNKNDKILRFIFKEKKNNYFNLLTDDLKFHICNYL
jgi:hypothetical protein